MFMQPHISMQLMKEREADIRRSLKNQDRGKRVSLRWWRSSSARRERRGRFRIRPAPLASASR
jgi:hypothetical protein